MGFRIEEEIIGHREVLDRLKLLRRQAEPPQALLFVGEESVGKFTLALAFAISWLCVKPQGGNRCGECDSCRKLSGELEIFRIVSQLTWVNHPDLVVLRPEPDQIKIEQIRQLRQWMSHAPLVAPYRAVLIERAGQLNLYAANALLKTLEEPPARYFFLLTAESTDQVLPTVLSRCRVLRLAPVKFDLLREELERVFHLTPDQASQLAEYAQGAPGRAVRWAIETTGHGKSSLEVFESLLHFYSTFDEAVPLAALRLAEQFRELCKGLEAESPDSSPRSALARGLALLAEWYRDTLVLDQGSFALRFPSQAESLHRLRRRFAFAKRLADLQAILETRKAILGNANAQIVTEALFIRLLEEA